MGRLFCSVYSKEGYETRTLGVNWVALKGMVHLSFNYQVAQVD